MIIFTTMDRPTSTYVCLYGNLEPEDSVPMLAEHLDGLASSTHLVVDLTELGLVGSPPVEELIHHLSTAPVQQLTKVLHPERCSTKDS